MEKFYSFIEGCCQKFGILHAFNEEVLPVIQNGEPFNTDCELEFYIEDGIPGNYHRCDVLRDKGAHFELLQYFIISSELKEIFEKYSSDVEYIPVRIYTDKEKYVVYYILHFTKYFDVIDDVNSDRINETITHLCVHYQKTLDLNLFWYPDYLGDVIISDKVYREIKKNKLTKGIDFRPVWCFDAPSEPQGQKAEENHEPQEVVEKGTSKENKLVKQNKSKRKRMNKFIEKEFDGWMAQVEKTAPDPQDYIAFNIGLFETEGGFAMYLYASDEYDEEDSDWTCGEPYDPNPQYLILKYKDVKTKDWEKFLNDAVEVAKAYLERHPDDSIFSHKIVTVGFDDGDLVRVQ